MFKKHTLFARNWLRLVLVAGLSATGLAAARLSAALAYALVLGGHFGTAAVFSAVAGYVQIRMYAACVRWVWTTFAPPKLQARPVARPAALTLSEFRDGKRRYH